MKEQSGLSRNCPGGLFTRNGMGNMTIVTRWYSRTSTDIAYCIWLLFLLRPLLLNGRSEKSSR